MGVVHPSRGLSCEQAVLYLAGPPCSTIPTMLDLTALHRQFDAFGSHRLQELRRQRAGLAHAVAALRACSPAWEGLKVQVQADNPTFLVAGLLDQPDRAIPCTLQRPAEVTLVATDGSQIYPERHIDPPCYLINVSQIAFQYGTLEPPVMGATPELRYRQRDLEGLLENKTESITAGIVSAIRDNQELEALYATALAASVQGRPLLAVADGTLIRWMLSGLNNPALEEDLITRYVETLHQFFEDQLLVCSYISSPGNTEMVNFLRWYLAQTPEGRARGVAVEDLAGLRDAHLFEQVLAPGERSVVFEAGSHIQKRYHAEDQICYFYLRVPALGGAEMARVELPLWIARVPAWVDLIHVLMLDQAEKGRGYPVILSEAHEHAVIRGQDTAVFYHLLDTQLRAAGMPPLRESHKRMSKQRPLI